MKSVGPNTEVKAWDMTTLTLTKEVNQSGWTGAATVCYGPQCQMLCLNPAAPGKIHNACQQHAAGRFGSSQVQSRRYVSSGRQTDWAHTGHGPPYVVRGVRLPPAESPLTESSALTLACSFRGSPVPEKLS